MKVYHDTWPGGQVPVPPVWPDAKLEAEMLASASTDRDEGCHIRALLERVRELERCLADGGHFSGVRDDQG